MKLKDGFVLRDVAGQTVVLPSGDDLDLNIMITLNGTGKFLWERIACGAEEKELVDALTAEYNVDNATAQGSVKRFVEKLRENGFIAD